MELLFTDLGKIAGGANCFVSFLKGKPNQNLTLDMLVLDVIILPS